MAVPATVAICLTLMIVVTVISVTVVSVLAMTMAVTSVTVMSAPLGPECHFIWFDPRVTDAGNECQHERERR